ncbi:excinuclease ABC subunit A [Leisingera aquaemixtae]|nr:excinuclease ABC subunit A [Leisingera aquaemixtae]
MPLAAGNGGNEEARLQCPQGLAVKASHCVPPGVTKKFYRRGDHILDDYTWIGQPGQWAPDPYGSYVQAGGYVYQVNRETQKVLRLIGAAGDLPY